jgi:hypothetical protein
VDLFTGLKPRKIFGVIFIRRLKPTAMDSDCFFGRARKPTAMDIDCYFGRGKKADGKG